MVNPGGDGDDPYTIQAWINPSGGLGAQVVVGNGNFTDSSGLALYVEFDQGDQQMWLKSQRGGPRDTVLTSSQPVPLNQWSNVATTYDGTTLALYLNGALVGSTAAPAIDTQDDPLLLIGACDDNAELDVGRYFQGWIQNAQVWTTALSAADVSTYMYADPLGQDGCIAAYTFAQSVAQNLMTGASVALIGGAALSNFLIHTTNTSEMAEQTAAVEALRRPAGPAKPVARDSVTIAPWTVRTTSLPEDVKARLLAEYDLLVPQTMGGRERATLLTDYAAALEQGARSVREADGHPIGMVRHAREGDRLVFYYRAPEGLYPVFEAGVADYDQCGIFMIEYLATAVLGLVACFGVPTSISRINKWLNQIFRNNRLYAAIATTLHEEITFRLVLSWVKIFYDWGIMQQGVSYFYADLSWWDFFFIAAQVVLAFIELIFPNPSTLAWVAMVTAKFAITLGQLYVMYRDRPAGCFGQG